MQIRNTQFASVKLRPRRTSLRLVAAHSGHSGQFRPTVLVTERIGNAGLDLLRHYANVETSYNLSPEDFKAKAPHVDALIVRSGTKVTREVFEASRGRIKVVGRAGVGIDNVDLGAATEYGCLVVNAPTANTVAAAEHGIALLCAMTRNISQADASVKAGRWERGMYMGTSITGKTMAVIGFGKVGSEVARRAKGLGLNVLAYDPYASVEKASALGVKLVSFDDALRQADFFSLHMPYTSATKHLLDASAFQRMKWGARIVNVARGGVIDENALLAALESGQVAQAALDVFGEEPPNFKTNRLIHHPNVICTPHLGASTTEAQEEVAIEVVEAVVDALMGKLSPNAVNAPMVPLEVLRELQPYITLAEGLGRAAVSLVKDKGFTDISITYSSPRGDDLDTRLLRANILKGVLEGTTLARVNLVNADLLAKNRGLKISEVTIRGDGSDVLASLSVSLNTSVSKFSAAVDRTGRIHIEGIVRNSTPFITKIGNYDVELAVAGSVLLTRQMDQPGIVAAVSTLLAKDNVNISFMTVGRTGKNQEAIMAIGIDNEPKRSTMAEVGKVRGVVEAVIFREVHS